MRSHLPLLVLIGILAGGPAVAEDSSGRSGVTPPAVATGSDAGTPQNGQAAGSTDNGSTAKSGPTKTDGSTTSATKSDDIKSDDIKTGDTKAGDGKSSKDTVANDKNGKSNGDKSGPHGVTGKDTATGKIDTSVTVNQGKVARKKDGKHNKNADSKLAGGKIAKDKQANLPRANHLDKPQRNAIGTVVAPDKTANVQPRSATGLPVTPATPSSNARPITGVPTAAAPANAGGATVTPPVKGPVASTSAQSAAGPAPANPSVVAGTALVKPVAHSGTIAGMPKLAIGAISGNMVHARHP
jgi:hypothetical protein